MLRTIRRIDWLYLLFFRFPWLATLGIGLFS